MLKLIVCIDKNFGIGKNNQLPWNVKQEMQHFKKTTLNHIVVMGHNTYLSINKPLPSRTNIVFSRNKNLKIKGVKVTDNINYVLELAKKQDVYIIGGKQIYNLFLPYVEQLIISQLHKKYDCDTFFKINLTHYQLKKQIKYDCFDVYYFNTYKNKLLDGRIASNVLINDLIKINEKYQAKTKIKPSLTIVQVGDLDASNLYINNKVNLAKKIDINVNVIKLKENIKQIELNNVIKKLNADKKVHGILIQAPLPKHLNINEVANLIDIYKDVDCFNAYNAGLLFRGQWDQVITYPCTPLGVIELLKYYNISLYQKHVVIIGRSNLVTKPLVQLMLKENATVTICHSKTKNINQYIKQADVICSAVGKANLINAKNIKKNAIIVDIAIARDQNNKLCGDVNFVDVINKVKFISPVPNGVGLMTLTMLFKNLLNLYACQLKIKK